MPIDPTEQALAAALSAWASKQGRGFRMVYNLGKQFAVGAAEKKFRFDDGHRVRIEWRNR